MNNSENNDVEESVTEDLIADIVEEMAVEPISEEAIEDNNAMEVSAKVDSEEAVELEVSFVEEDSSEIEEEFIPTEQLESILESILFATNRPMSIAAIKQAFSDTNIGTRQIKKALESLSIEYASVQRGITLEEVSGGYQLRSKVDNMDYLKKMVKARPFRLSGPALEVMSIVAYKQPLIKLEIDEIRGVESGHLLRALMDKGLVTFAGKSELPGKPMLYATTKKFLETFGLKSIKELPTLSEIDELLPEGIEVSDDKDPVLGDLTEELSEQVGNSYSEGEEELLTITSKLEDINTSSEFFEQEKQRQREKRDQDKAKDIEDAMAVGEEVSSKDQRWLARYQAKMAEALIAEDNAEIVVEERTMTEQEHVAVEEISVEEEPLETVSDEEIAMELAELDFEREDESSKTDEVAQ